MRRPRRQRPRTLFQAADRARRVSLVKRGRRGYPSHWMRENGLPQVLRWRWTPCAAFVLGSLSFVGFALLAIPDHIGHAPEESTTDSFRFGAALARTQPGPAPAADWSSDTTNTASATPSPVARVTTLSGDAASFPKRGFSPPLERPEPPPVPVAPPPPPPQPQLNLPPPAPPPVEAPPAQPPAPQQLEVIPQPPPTPDVPAPPPAPATD